MERGRCWAMWHKMLSHVTCSFRKHCEHKPEENLPCQVLPPASVARWLPLHPHTTNTPHPTPPHTTPGHMLGNCLFKVAEQLKQTCTVRAENLPVKALASWVPHSNNWEYNTVDKVHREDQALGDLFGIAWDGRWPFQHLEVRAGVWHLVNKARPLRLTVPFADPQEALKFSNWVASKAVSHWYQNKFPSTNCEMPGLARVSGSWCPFPTDTDAVWGEIWSVPAPRPSRIALSTFLCA